MRDALDCLALPGPFGGRRFNPASMFRATSTGLLLRSSRLDTLSQDAAGTTPANAPGQPVGLVSDLSGGGRHASQATSAARPTLGRHPRSGRRNLLTWTEDFTRAEWGKTRCVSTYDATRSMTLITADATPDGGRDVRRNLGNIAPNQPLTWSIDCMSADARYARLEIRNRNAAVNQLSAEFDLQTGAVSVPAANAGNATGASAVITSLGGGRYRLVVSGQPDTSGTEVTCIISFRTTSGANDTAINIPLTYISNGQLKLGASDNAYQRVTTDFDVTEAGQPDVWYLSTDAIDDWLATAAFEWGSDEVTIVAALRKRSDAAEGSLVSFVTGGGPGFRMAAPGGNSAWKFWSASKGTVETFAVDTNTARSAPVSAVVAMQGKISTDTNALRVNGAQVATSSSDQGVATTYGTQQFFIGRQTGASYPAAMDLYALFAINRLLSPAELAQVERWAANEMGVTL